MYYNKSLEEIEKELQVSGKGLTKQEVLARQKSMVKIYYLKRKPIIY